MGGEGRGKSLPQHVLTRMKKTEKDNRDLRATDFFSEKKIRILESRKTPQILRNKLKEHSSPDHRTHLVSISDGGGSFVLF